MREILFRGKRIDNGKWIEGLLHYSHGQGVWAITCSNGWIPSYSNPDEGEHTMFFDIIPETVCQFTGLTDKKRVKIFEGDICRVEYYNHASKNIVKIQEVSFQDGTFVLRSKDIDDSISIEESRSLAPIFWVYPPNKIEIIGNIHDNPELLK